MNSNQREPNHFDQLMNKYLAPLVIGIYYIFAIIMFRKTMKRAGKYWRFFLRIRSRIKDIDGFIYRFDCSDYDDGEILELYSMFCRSKQDSIFDSIMKELKKRELVSDKEFNEKEIHCIKSNRHNFGKYRIISISDCFISVDLTVPGDLLEVYKISAIKDMKIKKFMQYYSVILTFKSGESGGEYEKTIFANRKDLDMLKSINILNDLFIN